MGTKNTYGTGVKVKVAQSYLTLCNPMDYRVHGILQARILEWVAGPFSRGSSQPRDQTQAFHIAGFISVCLYSFWIYSFLILCVDSCCVIKTQNLYTPLPFSFLSLLIIKHYHF